MLPMIPDGIPVVGSFAHYYTGEEMLDTIIGLNPNKEEHQTTIDIEPVSTKIFLTLIIDVYVFAGILILIIKGTE